MGDAGMPKEVVEDVTRIDSSISSPAFKGFDTEKMAVSAVNKRDGIVHSGCRYRSVVTDSLT